MECLIVIGVLTVIGLLLCSLAHIYDMKKQFKVKILDLENQNLELKTKEKELKKELFETGFIIKNPNKFNISDEVKEGIILEKRIAKKNTDGLFLSYIMVLDITRQILSNSKPDFKNIDLITKLTSSRYWEYRIFNKENKSEKWIAEDSLNAI